MLSLGYIFMLVGIILAVVFVFTPPTNEQVAKKIAISAATFVVVGVILLLTGLVLGSTETIIHVNT